ncbi:MAG: GNAT family N-acetyltransferase [Deltaproteobacteria bacterium]|nr:GNAT family N-acetyltransferase [Deltaproteobacteria bacterium]
MIQRHDDPWEDPEFLAILSLYEAGLAAMDPRYPPGRTITFLDVPGIHTHVAREDGQIIGFIVCEVREDHSEIHELYVVPERRDGIVFRRLIGQALIAGIPLVFNVFKANERVLRLVAHVFERHCLAAAKIEEQEVWGVPSMHYELPPDTRLP